MSNIPSKSLLADATGFSYTPSTGFPGSIGPPVHWIRFEMFTTSRLPTPFFLPLVAGLCGAVLLSGCARRQMQINSFPEGAAVSVDHQPVGYTPVAVPFHYNGTREILLEKDGYKSIRVKQPIRGPWYFYPPFSLVTDNFATREIRDSQRFNFQLEPMDQVNDQHLTDRAENLRGQVLQGSITPSMQRDQYIWETR